MKPASTLEGRAKEQRGNYCPCTTKSNAGVAGRSRGPRHWLCLVGAPVGSCRVHTRRLTDCCSSPVGLPAAPIDVIPDCPPAAAAVAAAAGVLAPANMPDIAPLRSLLVEQKEKEPAPDCADQESVGWQRGVAGGWVKRSRSLERSPRSPRCSAYDCSY